MRERNDAMINGAMIALGGLGILDNVLFHWILQLHRAVPGPYALHVEVVIVILSGALLALGIWRERRARRQRE
jgi:hypothetical protein